MSRFTSVLFAFLAMSTIGRAEMVVTPWTFIFKGIEHCSGTNFPDAQIPVLQVGNCLRVDLRDPDVQLFASPRNTNYIREVSETSTLMISNYMRASGVKVATDCNFYISGTTVDPVREGLGAEVFGLLICTGQVVSVPDTGPDLNGRYASLMFTTNKEPMWNWDNRLAGVDASDVYTNPPGIFTAVTGFYPVLTNGVNMWVGSSNEMYATYPDELIHLRRQPRTIFGISEDKRFLYLVTIDGNQKGYSEGAFDVESGAWMQQFGAWDAVNMDGGNSTAMYKMDCAGNPIPMNHSSIVAARNRERIVGSHFGVFAQELPTFISGVAAVPEHTTALIRWTTDSNATSQVEYGLTQAYGTMTDLDPIPVTEHAVSLTGLSPGKRYYYRVISTTESDVYLSNCGGPFTTVPYPSSALVDLTSVWLYTTNNLDGRYWFAPNYDDEYWSVGQGVFYCDTKNPQGSTNLVGLPLNEVLPFTWDTEFDTNVPFMTYYFRTYFNFNEDPSTITSLTLSNYIDDGAAFYLNGTLIDRLCLAPGALNLDGATGWYCVSSDASCPYVTNLTGDVLTNLVRGDNVLAVEVHNLWTGSPDVTFGCSLSYHAPPPFISGLEVAAGVTNATISWLTLSNSTAQVEYGLFPNYGQFTPLDANEVTNHLVTLTGLSGSTPYAFRVISTLGETQYAANGMFWTYPFYGNLLPLTNNWRYTIENVEATDWKMPGFDDSQWAFGPALLWVDVRTPPNDLVQPKNTMMPTDPWDYVYTTYYLRTHFTNEGSAAGYSLLFSNYVDAGAAFYLNGTEVLRLRMAPGTWTIGNDELATGDPPGGDATSPEIFRLGGLWMTNLLAGDNVLAVELHTSDPLSGHVTFGTSLGLVRALVSETTLRVSYSNGVPIVSWDGTGFTLQESESLENPITWTDVPGPVRTSPYYVTNAGASRFYRLR